MTGEDRLRRALRDEAASIDASDGDAWTAVRRETGRRRRRRRAVGGGVLLAALAAVGVLAGVVGDGDEDPTTVAVGPDPSPTSTTSTTVLEGAPPLGAIWPFASYEELLDYRDDPGVGMFFDAEATALEFARSYLGMPDPRPTGGGVRPAEGASVSLDVVPSDTAPMTTRIWLHPYDGVFTVYHAESVNLVPDRESLGGLLGPTIALQGTSTAFEAHVDVEVRDVAGRTLGRTFVMGGANGEMGPFSGSIEVEQPSATEVGAVIFSTSSAADGTVQEATVVAVRFAPDVVAADVREFSVFFHRDEQLVEVRRTGPATEGVLRQALGALVAGPQSSDGAGLMSLFSAATADVLAGVNLREGTAVVDFARTVDNASTSAGSAAFLESLNATAFQFETVERIEYRLEGSCDAFWSWLQVGECRTVSRPD